MLIVLTTVSSSFFASTALFGLSLHLLHSDEVTIVVDDLEVLLLLHDELGGLHSRWNRFLRSRALAFLCLFLQHTRLHFSSLLLDLVGLLDNQVLTGDVRIRLLEPDHRVESL